MEAAEATAVEGAILWLAQTIVETLQPGELDAWLHRVGLAGDIGKLKSEVERMETVVNGAKGRAVGNKPLARSLARVKELMYDADDVVDELDYCRLQHQVEGVMIAPAFGAEGMVGDGAEQVDASANTAVMLAPEPEGVVGDGDRAREEQADVSSNNTGTLNISGRKNRSEVWDYFHIIPSVNGVPAKAKCNHCSRELTWGHGTSALHKHIKSCNKKRSASEEMPNHPSVVNGVKNGAPVSTNDSEYSKRMRTEYNVATTTHIWDKAEFLKRIQEIVLELRSIRGNVIECLKDSIALSNECQINNSDTRVRTSSSLTGKVYGRNWDKNKTIWAIKAAKSDNITVLPIVGIIGVGKTTLAKLVYHDQLVEREFERIWVWVSNIFDEVRVTREILDVVTLASHEASSKRESYEGVRNYSRLLEVLQKHMACVSKKFLLVLDDVCHSQWKDLIDALGSSCRKGNVIIVTTRNLSIAERLGTIKPIELKALSNDVFLQLFRACAFGDNNYKEHLDTSRQICAKLKGNPLAAKSAAEMLREQPSLHHWKNIIKNGIWESLQLRGGIVTALKNIYYHLPYHLQQCFLVCSIFPSDHQFHIDGLVSMWISSGFVKSIEAGQECLNALVNSCFFEQVGTEDDSILQQCYVKCGMMHEFARLVSRTEFATIDGLECKEVLPTVRHLSIQNIDVCENIVGHMKFEEKLQSIASSLRRLRTLILVGRYDSLSVQFNSFHAFEFNCFHTFLSNWVNCTHLRYLKLENKGITGFLRISLSKFYHLEILDARSLAIFHNMSDLRNMRHLVLITGACGDSLARFASLQTVHLEDSEGHEILPSLENLSSLTKLKLRNMTEVTELLIPSLEELVLIDMPKLGRCSSSPVKDLNSSLRVLEIRGCRVLKAFPLFERCENFEIEQKSWLPNITKLTILECPDLVVSNPLPPSSSFCKLSISGVSTLPTMEGSPNMEGFKIGGYCGPSFIGFLDNKILSFHNLRTITWLEIVCCKNLLYISLEGLKQLICLKRLEIWDCPKVFSSNVLSTHTHEDMAATNLDALPSLKCLSITRCGTTGQRLSVMLQHMRALGELNLDSCKQITGLLIEGKDDRVSSLSSVPRASSQESPDGTSTRPCLDKLLRVPANLVPSLKKMSIKFCELKFEGSKEEFSGFTSLEELIIAGCPELISSLVHEDETDEQANGRWLLPCSLGVLDIDRAFLGALRPCFPGDLTRLTVLQVTSIDGLKSLQLHSCTALEKLKIEYCESLDALEGLQSLHGLRYLEVLGCPSLPQCLESLSTQSYELCPRLERLWIDDPSFLTTPFCKHLTSLQSLQLGDQEVYINMAELTCEQEAALQLLISLQQLRFDGYTELSALPVGLHSLASLKQLEISDCPNFSRLPERCLPPSLEELVVCGCSKELTEQCRMLATSKLRVTIDWECVN